MSAPNQHSQDVVVFLDPRGDVFARHLTILKSKGIGYRLCTSIQDFCSEIVKVEVCCAVALEESLTGNCRRLIQEVVQLQPSWREVPLFVIAAPANAGLSASESLEKDLPEALYLSAPVSEATFLSMVQLAKRHRARQGSHLVEAAPAVEEIPALERPKEVGNLGGPIQVLLVDDHEIVLKGLRGVMAFYSDIEIVGEARSGIEAMSMAEELQPHVIIMDVNMPMGNGIEVTRAIKETFPGIIIIGLSVYNDTAIVNSMREAGADAFLEKGIDENVIHAAIQAHTQRADAQMKN